MKGKSIVNKRKISVWKIIIPVIAAMLAAVLFFPIVSRGRLDDGESVATVNGEPICVREFRLNMSKEVSGVYAYFRKNYGAEDSKGFWTAKFGDEAPIDILRKKTLDACVRIKVQQMLAREKQIVVDISYEAFLERWKAENKRREEAIKNKEAVYGPEKYDEQTFYIVFMSDMVSKLKSVLIKEAVITEEDLKKTYEQQKGKIYKKTDEIKLQRIYIPLNGKEGQAEEIKSTEGKMEKILEKLHEGADFEALGQSPESGAGMAGIVFDELSLDENTGRRMRIELPELIDQAYKLLPEEISGIIREADGLYIIKCMEIKDRGYFSFDEVKDKVRTIKMEELYKSKIDELVSGARVVINRKVLGRIQAR